MKQTIAFHNTSNYWKTRYSYTSSCMMHLNKLFFTSPFDKVPNDVKTSLIYRHNDSSSGFNRFYDDDDQSLPSALAVSFNGFTAKSARAAASNTSSSNKIFKSFSISGLNDASTNTDLEIGASSFIVNNNSNPSSGGEGFHVLSPLKRKGNSVYGEIGKELEMSGTNIKAIGRIKDVYKWYQFNEDEGVNVWYHLTGDDEITEVEIAGLHVDENGLDVAPNLGALEHLYAFEIESFMSNNPLPSASTGDSFAEYVKFFSGRVNSGFSGMESTPYRKVSTSPQYTPVLAHYQVNFDDSINFDVGDNFSRYLSYGDPFYNENNTFKKNNGQGNFLMMVASDNEFANHVKYERTPGCASNNSLISPQYTWSAPAGQDRLVNQGREILFAMTPGFINGADPHGSYADAFVIINGDAAGDFEVSSLQVEYEFTEYDHGGVVGTASKAKGKK